MSNEGQTIEQHLDQAAASLETHHSDALPKPGSAARVLTEVVRGISPDDLRASTPQEIADFIALFLSRASRREAGTSIVAFGTGSSPETGRPLTALDIVTDDMPFLVDSLSNEIERHGLIIHMVIHPQMKVRRDGAGHLLDVVDTEPHLDAEALEGHEIHDDEVEPGPGIEESWMRFLIEDPASSAEQDQLEADLRRILRQTRTVFEDWDAMHERAHDLAEQLRAHPPAGISAETATDAANLLDWLTEHNFTFLGVRSYRLLDSSDETVRLQAIAGTGLGLLRDSDGEAPVKELPEAAARKAREKELIFVTKINRPSTIHKPVPLDYIGIKTFDDAGEVTGEHRIIGLLTPASYQASVLDVPLIAPKVATVLADTGYDPDGHLGKDLLGILEDYPRDELFQISPKQLTDIATTVVHLPGRRRTRAFVRRDPYGRYASLMVFMPRDRYSVAVRNRLTELMRDAFGGDDCETTALVTTAPLARVHFVVWGRKRSLVADVDGDTLASEIAAITRLLDEDVAELVAGSETGPATLRMLRAMPPSYKDTTSAETALIDAEEIAALGEDTRVRLVAGEDGHRLRVYAARSIPLSESLPLLSDFGIQVSDEHSYRAELDGREVFLHDLGISAEFAGDDGEARRLEDAVEAVLSHRAEADRFNALVLSAQLPWRDVVILRALASYLRQTKPVYSTGYIIDTLTTNAALARDLRDLFYLRFDPASEFGAEVSDERRAALSAARKDFLRALDAVSSIDQDTILRSLAAIIAATLRTNFFAEQASVALAFKIDPHAVPELPALRPKYEIWVHGPRVQGVHLRFGEVARGGLRWSDRKEDFRTEVLGLVKAQMVKNAVIVPTGSKGGFVATQLPDPALDRQAWLDEGTAAYVQFISAMLSVTDNRVEGEIVPPAGVVRYDGDDPYLVVAADKGTAAFSDTANAVAREHGFWLDDAFASGGSAGYDHKKMGITARGAWESVKRHFRELGHDTQTEDFTVVGIGDMSGDVFGNGMLLSEHIRLIGAFDHRHVFIDPNPDAATSYAERKRLFTTPRSSWDDYNRDLISAGGGVFARTAKSIDVTPEMREALGLDEDVTEVTPTALIQAVLKAPVDLLWNGGIGTYVRGSSETDDQIGDRANDPIRITGAELRVQVVGEGGNLGFSQLGRIEAAQHGVHINTDAIDNSGGVDSSDLEVNIKILLAPIVERGELTMAERNELLAEMTDDVARLVLRQNYEQNVLLGNARFQDDRMLGSHMRLMEKLEDSGELDRALEFLPSDEELHERQEAGHGLVTPEFAVLVAYAKMSLKDQLLATDLPDEEWTAALVADHFPPVLAERYSKDMAEHSLRREIVVTELANSIINRGGITFVTRAMDETGASADQVARAFIIAREVFALRDFVAGVEQLDGVVATEVSSEMYLTFRRLLDRAARWFLHNRPSDMDVTAEIEQYRERIAKLRQARERILPESFLADMKSKAERYQAAGVGEDLAGIAATLLDQAMWLDVIEIADETGEDPEEIARLHFGLAERLRLRDLLHEVSELPQTDLWDALARSAIRADVAATNAIITRAVIEATTSSESDPLASAMARQEQWEEQHSKILQRVDAALDEIHAMDHPQIAPLSVGLRQLRSLVRSS